MILLFSIFLLICFYPSLAFASTGATEGFFAGFNHPIAGTDHLIAMICVGIASTQIGGRAIFTVPTMFVLLMVIGGTAGILLTQSIDHEGLGVYIIEHGIKLSVITLGLVIALNRKIHIGFIMAMIAFFGFCHGYAHGAEIPSISHSLTYIIGFILSTSLLHLFGVGIGEFAKRRENGETTLRYIGAVILGVGIGLLYGWLSITYGF